MTSSSLTKNNCFHEESCQLIGVTPKNLIWLSDYQLFSFVEHLLLSEIVRCIFYGMWNIWIIFLEYRCYQCWRHKRSPCERMFVTALHCIFWRLDQNLSHSIIHPVQEWPWLWRKVWFCGGVRVHIIVINDKPVCVLSERTGWLSTHGSPLEKSTCRQYSILSGLMNESPSQVSPFSVADHSTSSEDITSRQLVELKWLMLNKNKRWFHSSRAKLPLVSMSASWFLSIDVFDLDLGIQINRVKQPIQSNPVGPRKKSHCRASSLYGHLDHCFVGLQRKTTKLPFE